MHSICSKHPLDCCFVNSILAPLHLSGLYWQQNRISKSTYTNLFHLSFCNFDLKVTCTEEVSNPYNITKTFILKVVNVNEAPGGISITSNTIAENLDPGSVVGRVYAVDPDNEVFLWHFSCDFQHLCLVTIHFISFHSIWKASRTIF